MTAAVLPKNYLSYNEIFPRPPSPRTRTVYRDIPQKLCPVPEHPPFAKEREKTSDKTEAIFNSYKLVILPFTNNLTYLFASEGKRIEPIVQEINEKDYHATDVCRRKLRQNICLQLGYTVEDREIYFPRGNFSYREKRSRGEIYKVFLRILTCSIPTDHASAPLNLFFSERKWISMENILLALRMQRRTEINRRDFNLIKNLQMMLLGYRAMVGVFYNRRELSPALTYCYENNLMPSIAFQLEQHLSYLRGKSSQPFFNSFGISPPSPLNRRKWLLLDIDETILFPSFHSCRVEEEVTADIMSLIGTVSGIRDEVLLRKFTVKYSNDQWHRSDIVPVERKIIEEIRNYQNRGYSVFGFTARMQIFSKITEEILTKVGVDFTKSTLPEEVGLLNGVVYCGRRPKGEVLTSLIQKIISNGAYASYIPEEVAFIDDRSQNVYSVSEAVTYFPTIKKGVFMYFHKKLPPYSHQILQWEFFRFIKDRPDYFNPEKLQEKRKEKRRSSNRGPFSLSKVAS